MGEFAVLLRKEIEYSLTWNLLRSKKKALKRKTGFSEAIPSITT